MLTLVACVNLRDNLSPILVFAIISFPIAPPKSKLKIFHAESISQSTPPTDDSRGRSNDCESGSFSSTNCPLIRVTCGADVLVRDDAEMIRKSPVIVVILSIVSD